MQRFLIIHITVINLNKDTQYCEALLEKLAGAHGLEVSVWEFLKDEKPLGKILINTQTAKDCLLNSPTWKLINIAFESYACGYKIEILLCSLKWRKW